MFRITTQTGDGGATLLVVHGALDLANAPALLAQGKRAVASGSSVSLDLGDVDVLDEIGIGVLLGLRRRAGAAGVAFAVVEASSVVADSFAAHGVADLFA